MAAELSNSLVPVSHLRLRLRSDLRISTDDRGGFVIEDPIRGHFFRLGSSEYCCVARLDGQTSLREAAQQAGSNRPFSPAKLEALGRWLMVSGLVESPGPPGAVAPAPLPTAGNASAFNPLYVRLSWGAPGRWLVHLERALGWLFTAPAVAAIALLSILAALLFNANPLCRLDGYYLLSDLLHWPNLAEQGRCAARTWLQWVFWGDVTASDNISPRRDWQALIYGVAAALWRLTSLLAMSIVVVLAYEGFGLLLLAGIGITWTWQSRQGLASQRWNPSLQVDRFTRLATRLTIGALALVLLAWLVPWPGAVRAPGIVESVERHVVRARTAGHVDSLLVHNGQRIAAGQKLAVLRNAELELELRNLALAYELGEAKERSLLTKRELLELQVQRQRQETLREQIEEQRRKLANLTLYSPANGFVVARRLNDLSGGFLAEGAELCLIVESGFEFRLAIAQRDLPYALACVGKRIDVRLAGQRVAGTLNRLEPHASTALLDTALGANAGGPLCRRFPLFEQKP